MPRKSATSATPNAQARAAATRRERTKKQAAFLKALAKCGVIAYAAEKAKVDRSTVWRWCRGKAFKRRFDEAIEVSTELLEREAYRRAFEGVERPVYQQKELVGHIREYSDGLTMFLLRARKPDTYRERMDLNHGGRVALDLQEQLRKDDADLRAHHEAEMAKRRAAGGPTS